MKISYQKARKTFHALIEHDELNWIHERTPHHKICISLEPGRVPLPYASQDLVE